VLEVWIVKLGMCGVVDCMCCLKVTQINTVEHCHLEETAVWRPFWLHCSQLWIPPPFWLKCLIQGADSGVRWRESPSALRVGMAEGGFSPTAVGCPNL